MTRIKSGAKKDIVLQNCRNIFTTFSSSLLIPLFLQFLLIIYLRVNDSYLLQLLMNCQFIEWTDGWRKGFLTWRTCWLWFFVENHEMLCQFVSISLLSGWILMQSSLGLVVFYGGNIYYFRTYLPFLLIFWFCLSPKSLENLLNLLLCLCMSILIL